MQASYIEVIEGPDDVPEWVLRMAAFAATNGATELEVAMPDGSRIVMEIEQLGEVNGSRRRFDA